MKWVIFFILSFSFVAHSFKDSSKELYNQGVSFLKENQKTKALSSFRKAVVEDPWNRSAQRALHHLDHPLSFWWLIPYELFLSLILLGITLLFFPFRIWKIIFLCMNIILASSFWYYRSIPRWTLLKDASLKSAPDEKASTVVILKKSSFVIQKGTHNKEWVQIKTSDSAGWLKRSFLD